MTPGASCLYRVGDVAHRGTIKRVDRDVVTILDARSAETILHRDAVLELPADTSSARRFFRTDDPDRATELVREWADRTWPRRVSR